jgi:hypothetical protein
LKNTTFLFVVFSRDQAKTLIKASLGSQLVPLKKYLFLNPFQGVATIDALDAVSDKEIPSSLVKQFVSKAYNLIGERDGRPCPAQ